MPTTQTNTTQTSNVQNIPSQAQNNWWGGIMGAATGLVWPDGNFALAPQYPGQINAPQGQQISNWYNLVNNLQNPDFNGVMQGNANLFNQTQSGLRDPNQINFSTNYQPQQFNVPGFQMTDPLTGYNGGGPGMQVQAPGGVSGLASSYQVPVDQVQAPQGVSYDRISGLPQIQAPNLQNYQMQGPQNVQAPSGLSSYQIAAAPLAVQTGTVGTQSWTQPGTAQQYMSPYTQQVLDAQKANMNADYAQQLTQQHAQAAQAGAFGGSRQAVQDAESQRNLNLQLQQMEASGLQSAYGQGAQQFNTEQQLGLQGQQFNVQTGMQAGLANQQAQLQTALANQQAALAAQGLGTTTGMQAALANQQAGLATNTQNLQALLQTQGLGAQLGMQGQLANQQMAYNQQLANQQAGINVGEFNNTQAMQAQQLNQAANLQAGLAAQQMGLQGATTNAGLSMQAQLANQQAQQNQYQRQLAGLTTQYGGNLQAGLQSQNLGMQAQQLGMQSNQFAAGLSLQQQTAQQQARQAAQNANLGYLQFAGNLNQQNGNWQQQGFQNNLANIGVNQQAGLNQQAVDQAAADRNYQYWQQQMNFPYQQVGWLAQLATMVPQQGSVQSTQQGVDYTKTPGPSPWNIAAGLATTGIGAFTGGLGGGVGKGLMSNLFGSAKGGLIADAEPIDYAYTA